MKNNFIIFLSASCLIFILSILFSTNHLISNHQSLTYGCECLDFSGKLEPNEITAFYEGRKIEIPKYAYDLRPIPVLGANQGDKWIEVDLSEQSLKAWNGNSLFLETKVSTGLPWTPTPVGVYSIWMKLRATKMEGGQGKYYYYLPNVPYVMFLENDKVPGWKGYGLHGTYWHNDFGTPHSHGCVNLPTPIAKELYYWVSPVVPEGKSMIRSSAENPGTRVVIHE
jgi:hypothetical protein